MKEENGKMMGDFNALPAIIQRRYASDQIYLSYCLGRSGISAVFQNRSVQMDHDLLHVSAALHRVFTLQPLL
jgi:hypothetical protein